MVDSRESTPSVLPSVERIQQELARVTSIDDFFGKESIFARLFADTLEQMLEAELTAHLGYPRHAPEGRNSGNSRNGKRSRQLRTSRWRYHHPGAARPQQHLSSAVVGRLSDQHQ